MNKAFFISALLYAITTGLPAQSLNYAPDVVFGHRSFTYMHQVNGSFHYKVRLNNLVLFDTDYKNREHKLFFIRTTVSYLLTENIALNAAAGMKSPGSFLTLSAQYRLSRPGFSFAYSVGATSQAGFTLEQALAFEVMPRLTATLRGYLGGSAIANVNLDGYQRGLQFIRLGLKTEMYGYGLALNLDQFNNNQKKLANGGIYFRYKF
jgi:hypothetical protein